MSRPGGTSAYKHVKEESQIEVSRVECQVRNLHFSSKKGGRNSTAAYSSHHYSGKKVQVSQETRKEAAFYSHQHSATTHSKRVGRNASGRNLALTYDDGMSSYSSSSSSSESGDLRDDDSHVIEEIVIHQKVQTKRLSSSRGRHARW